MQSLKTALMMALFSAYLKAGCEHLFSQESALKPLWQQVGDCADLTALARLAAKAWPCLPASLPTSHRDLLHELRLISEMPQPLDEPTEYGRLTALPNVIWVEEWIEGLKPLSEGA
ncbi:MAG: hypothetical protein Q7S64_02815 [bacterium]|nr:hypothetical protein [bacterium]